MKQVEASHYEFKKYIGKKRWISFWHQLDTVLSLKPSSVLEIGSGPGLFKAVSKHFGLNIESVDIDPDLNPDHVSSALDLPFKQNSYECVCAFQMLEHLPYQDSLKAFSEMVRVSDKYIVISLPDARILWLYTFHIPKLGEVNLRIPKPQFSLKKHRFDGEHYWEINKKGYPLQKIIREFELNQLRLLETYRVTENSYHRFFVFEKLKDSC